MEIAGGYNLRVSKEEIWEVLNSKEHLQHIIPGCTSLDQTGDNSYKAEITTRVGPMKVKFVGKVDYVDLKPFNSFRIEGQGEGGPAGFAKGSVDITLSELDNGETHLAYKIRSDVGGKLAALGSRLLEAVSKRNIELFFEGLQTHLDRGDEVIKITKSTTTVQTKVQDHSSWSNPTLQIINTLSFVAMAVAIWVIALK